MAGIQHRVIRQGQDLVADAGEQVVFVADVQIGAAYAVIKNKVAAESGFFGKIKIGDVAKGVAGGVQNGQAGFSQRQGLSICHDQVGHRPGIEFKTEVPGTAACFPKVQIQRVHSHGDMLRA